MGYFPFFTDVTKLYGVIIGGGHVALEKVTRLMNSGAKLTVIAPDIHEDIRKLGDAIELIQDSYKSDYLKNADYVIAATGITELNEQIYCDAKKNRLLINVVDVPDKCDFIFPAVTQRGRLVIGVSSSGAGPQVAIRIRNDIEKMIPDNIEEILDILTKERINAKENIKDPKERKRYLIALADKLLNYEE